ncbi:MAG: flagellar filament capping protein FliD [Nitrospirae bacterium]|nr:flagellar filament capping protein FliD [Nitrospirota bacterium]
MSGRITVTGLVSGIDFESIITQLMQIERDTRITPIEESIAENDAKISALEQYNSLISSVRSAAGKLNTISGSRPKTGTSSDTNKIRVTSVGTNAIQGAYSVTQARKLAQGEMLASKSGASGSDITQEVHTFAIRSNGLTRTVSTVDFTNIAEASQLTQLATDINQDAGDIVTAYVVNDGLGDARLVVQSKVTGSTLDGGDTAGKGNLGDVSFSINAGTSLVMMQNLGLVTGAYAGGALTTDAQEANVIQDNYDLSISVGSVSFQFDSNTVSTLIPGVSLEFLSTFNSGTVTVTVNNDTATLQSNIQALVDAYNAMATFYSQQVAFDEDTETAGILQSDTAVRTMKDVVANALGLDVVSQPVNYRSVADIGIKFLRDGQLDFDTSKLATAMASSFNDVGELFRGFKFTSDNFDPNAAGLSLGDVTGMSFKINGISLGVGGVVSGATNRDQLNSLRDLINEDGRGILQAKVVDQPDGSIRLVLYGDSILFDENVMSLSAGGSSVAVGFVSTLNASTTPKNPSSAVGSAMEDMLKDLIDGTGTAGGIIQSELDELDAINQRNEERIEEQEEIIDNIEARLRAKFTALEASLAQMQSQGDFISSILGSSGG